MVIGASCSTAATQSTSWRNIHIIPSPFAYLLLHGELPTNDEFREFRDVITHHTMVHEQLLRFYSGFRRDAHPSPAMLGIVGALSAFYRAIRPTSRFRCSV